MKSTDKVSDVEMLQIEMKRLEEICRAQEEVIRTHLVVLREHPVKSIMQSIFPPHSPETKGRVIKVLEVMGTMALPLIFGLFVRKRQSNLKRNFRRLIQSAVMALAIKAFRRKKAANEEEQVSETD